MPRVRYKHKSGSKWYIGEEEFRYAHSFALMYEKWRGEYMDLFGVSAVSYDGMPGGSDGSPTERLAIRRAELYRKCAIVEQTATEADAEICQWILKAVTRGLTFRTLKMKYDMPCGQTHYYQARRKFYYLLSKKI